MNKLKPDTTSTPFMDQFQREQKNAATPLSTTSTESPLPSTHTEDAKKKRMKKKKKTWSY